MKVELGGLPAKYEDVAAGVLFAFADERGVGYGCKVKFSSTQGEAWLILHHTGRDAPDFREPTRQSTPPPVVYVLNDGGLVPSAIPNDYRQSIRNNPTLGAVVVTATDKMICVRNHEADAIFFSLETGLSKGYEVTVPSVVFKTWSITAMKGDVREVLATQVINQAARTPA